jgi:glucan phosphoethanolaminetransferase (alkaline phosphatase superfamily)
MNNLLNVRFWFNSQPEALLPQSSYILIALIALMFVLAVAAWILKSRKGFYRRLWGKLGIFFISNTLIGFVLWFFSEELVPFLSARFWYLLWLAGIIAWLFFLARSVKNLPEKKKELQREEELKKYIP